MTVTHTKNTGTTGKLTAQDNTDNPSDRIVHLSLSSTSYVQTPISWSYLVNGVVKGSGYEGEIFENSLTQYFGGFFVGPEFETFTFRIENTGTTQLGGPTSLTFTLAGYESDLVEGTVRVKVGTTYKQATPYVKKGGIWKLAKPFVKRPTGWKETT